nr:cilia- and flagella-associated protein 73 isoform X1 [Anser cygnoides]
MSPGLEESLRRVFQEKLQLRTVPAWDSASLLPSSTRLLLKRREVAEVERALQAQREEFWQRMEGLDQRRQQLGQREEQLRDVALRFDAFLKVSAARRERALGRAGEERARAAQRGAEADGLQQELAGLLRRREQLRRRLRGLRVFGNYLRGVVATTGQVRVPVPCPQGVVFLQGHQHPLHPKLHVGASVGGSGGAGTQNRLRDEGEQHLGGVGAPATARPLPTTQFQDVPSMLAHFGALAGVRAALLHQLEAGQQRLAQGRARLQRYHEEAGGELLRGRDEVVQLRARLEAVRHDVLQGESCWTQIQSAATHKTLLLGQIRMAVLSLFQLATKHLKVPRDVALEDTETQLDVLWHQGPHLPRCCSACRTWLPSVLSCAPRSQGWAPHVCLPPPPLAHGTTGVSRCLRATSSPSLGTNPPGVRLPRPAWSCRTPAPTWGWRWLPNKPRNPERQCSSSAAEHQVPWDRACPPGALLQGACRQWDQLPGRIGEQLLVFRLLVLIKLFPIKIQPSCGAAAPASFRAAAWGGITPVTSCPQEAPRGGRIQNQTAI